MRTGLLITHSPEETMNLGQELASEINEPIFIGLYGSLGAGKTVFVKGLAKGMGIKDEITSPSFLIVKIYNGRLRLFHIDLYRVVYPDMDMLGEYIYGDGVCVVEWSERLLDFLPEKRIDVKFEIRGKKEREIKIEPVGY